MINSKPIESYSNQIKYPTTIMNSKSKFTVFMVHNMIHNKLTNQSSNLDQAQSIDKYIFQKPNLSYYSYQSNYQDNFNSRMCNKSLSNIDNNQEQKQLDLKRKKFSSFYTAAHKRTPKDKFISHQKIDKPHKTKNFNQFIMKNLKQIMEKPNQKPQQQLNFGLQIRKAKKYSTLMKKQQIRIKLKSSSTKKSPNIILTTDFQRQRNLKVHQQSAVITQPDKIKEQTSKQCLLSSLNKQIIQPRSSKTRQFNLSKQFPLRIQKYDSKYSKIKYIKMNNCLNIILSSFDYYLDHPFNHIVHQEKKSLFNRTVVIQHRTPILLTQEDQQKVKKIVPKYLYYIGYGNNAELIRSIFKKRNWWAQTSDLQQANLIWTQIKSKKIINKINKFYSKDFEPVKQKQQILYSKTRSNFRINKIQIFNSILQRSFQKSKKQKKTSIISNIFHPQQQTGQIDHLLHNFNKPKSQFTISPYKHHILHNHYNKNYMFGNKNALYFNLSKYYKYIKQDVGQIIPLTYYLQQDQQQEINNFYDKFQQLKSKNLIWILKPGQNTNRGQRIVVVKELQDIKTKLKLQKKLIIQSYIKNLFLYDGRKFDIRTYMLALTINGRLKFYFYDEGYIRTSSQPFNLNDLNDKFIHLTNDAIQKHSQNYGKYQDGNKISYNEFQRYLDNKFVKNSYSVKELHNQMKKITIEAVKATYVNFQPSCKFNFQLFGLDFIVNSHFKPYLIEINTNACLELSSNILQRLIPRMMQNLFRLSVDPLFRPDQSSKIQSYYLYDESFLTKNKFNLIFDQKYDKNQQWQQFLSKQQQDKSIIMEQEQIHD